MHLLGQHRNAGTDPLLLPRIRFKQRLNRYDRRTPSVTRLQFPVALAYAMTYNRAQGATLAKVGIDVREPSFMHGHTYVAFSRAQSRDAVVVLAERLLPSSGFPEARTQLHQGRLYSSPLRES